jgi:membrane-bound lytic murein transglycosylase F
MNKIRSPFFLAFLTLGLLLGGCAKKPMKREIIRDWEQIKKAGKLTVLTENTTLSYFEFRGKPMGFEYEILDTFCKANHLELEVKIVSDNNDFSTMLRNGEGDIVAANLPISRDQEKDFAFSFPFYQTYQVLVQRKSDDVLTEPARLVGKPIYVRKNSSYEKRLIALQDEIGAALQIRHQKTMPLTEDLIEEVVSGRISYTLAHENQARIAKDMHPNLDISTRMSFEQRIAFGLAPKNGTFKKKLNAFLKKYTSSDAYAFLKKRYFDYIVVSEQPQKLDSTPRGSISPYDAIFKKAAAKYNWDWKILAAVAFKESRFNPNARGFGGAYGMMQFMPCTGPSFGVYPDSDPETQINGGMRYLHSMSKSWSSIADEYTRMQFVLASYNAGMGHIQDAQRLARAAGLNPNLWDGNVAVMVNKLADPEYYRSELVRCGAYRGAATAYTAHVMAIYSGWK